MNLNLKVNLTFDVLTAEEKNALEPAVENLLKHLLDTNEKQEKNNKDLLKKVWPHLLDIQNWSSYSYEIILLPLNRVGAQIGASGCRVFVSYLEIDKDGSCPSNPLIFKYFPIIKSDSVDKLEEEKRNAESVDNFVNDHFATPFHHSKHNNYSFLWSLFKSAIYPYQDGRHNPPRMQENNLWKLITSTMEDRNASGIEKVNDIINTTYNFFVEWHSNNGNEKFTEKTYYEEYEWYLRGFDKWKKQLVDIWADDKTMRANDFGSTWINPLWVYENIKNVSFCHKIGAIHGDLHPRNIVIAHEGVPHIIDFGWTQPKAHIAKDFALMEANIRFVSLSPDYSYAYLQSLAESIETEAVHKKEEIDPVYKWLWSIRTQYIKHYMTPPNLLCEYIIPLFLISLGLLKFTNNISNQISARLNVLSLAQYIYKNKLKNE